MKKMTMKSDFVNRPTRHAVGLLVSVIRLRYQPTRLNDELHRNTVVEKVNECWDGVQEACWDGETLSLHLEHCLSSIGRLTDLSIQLNELQCDVNVTPRWRNNQHTARIGDDVTMSAREDAFSLWTITRQNLCGTGASTPPPPLCQRGMLPPPYILKILQQLAEIEFGSCGVCENYWAAKVFTYPCIFWNSPTGRCQKTYRHTL